MERYLIEIVEEETQDIIQVYPCPKSFTLMDANMWEDRVLLGLDLDKYYTRLSLSLIHI